MSYAPGDSEVTINNYLVYIRTHRTAETVDSEQRLKALAWDFETIKTNVDADEDLTISGNDGQGGSIYGLDATGGAVAIDLANYPGGSEAPVDGDVIIFYAVNVDSAVTITDETAGTAVVTTLDAVGEAVAIEYVTDTWTYWCMLNDTGDQIREYTNIGRCEEKPYIKTGASITKMFEDGNEKDVAESIEYGFKDLQVNAANRTFLKSTIGRTKIDVLYLCKVEGTVYPTKSVRLVNIPFKSFLEITGNEINMATTISKKDVSNVQDVLTMGLDT